MIESPTAMTKHMTKRTTRPSKTARTPKTPALAMHSAASPEWGTPMLLQRFAVSVLRPAAKTTSAIDLDYSSASYWQQWWPDGDKPYAFLDGSKGRDVLVAEDRDAACTDRGSGFENAPGIAGGEMVKLCWELFEIDHRDNKLGSGFWVGYSVETLGSLQNVGARNPLTCGEDDLITTIVPSRRAHYVVHPEDLIAITQRKMKKRDRGSKQRRKEQVLIERLRNRTDDAPVDAGAPSHLSYVTLLWHRERAVRRVQMEAARQFLKEQSLNEKSLLHKFEAIGPLELETKK